MARSSLGEVGRRYRQIVSRSSLRLEYFETPQESKPEEDLLNKESAKKVSRFLSLLRYTVYQRLYTLVILPNLVAITYLSVEKDLLHSPATCLNAVAFNIAATILIRQEYIINLLYRTIGCIPHWAPFAIRKRAAKLYHLGGIHSSAGVAAAIWFLLFNVAAVREWSSDIPSSKAAIATISVSAVVVILFLQILLFSTSKFRTRYHNTWEQIHRFAGWLLLGCFWVHLIVYNIYRSEWPQTQPIGKLFYANPGFYTLVISTLSIMLPWLSLRRVKPRIEGLSKHAIRLHFDYASISACKTPRFATDPLFEWHSFASIPNEQAKGFSIVISRAGDWTGNIIDNPPQYLWTRGRPARGTLYMAKLFKTILCVATGSGIAPILGLFAIPNTRFRVLWAAPNPDTTFGADVVRKVLQADPEAVIWNTRVSSRPDLVREAKRMYDEREEEIEAVFVISNEETTTRIVYGLESKGVPAFGPIFDS